MGRFPGITELVLVRFESRSFQKPTRRAQTNEHYKKYYLSASRLKNIGHVSDAMIRQFSVLIYSLKEFNWHFINPYLILLNGSKTNQWKLSPLCSMKPKLDFLHSGFIAPLIIFLWPFYHHSSKTWHNLVHDLWIATREASWIRLKYYDWKSWVSIPNFSLKPPKIIVG